MAGDAASASKKRKSQAAYELNQLVWAQYEGGLYKAKVLKVERDGSSTSYLVHFQGWNKKWDRLVDEGDLMSDSEEAQNMAKDLEVPKKGVKKGQGGKKGVGGKKPSTDAAMDIEEPAGTPQIKISIPFTLKRQLVTDWEFVTQQPKLLVPLPRSVTVVQMMYDFIEMKKKEDSEAGASAAGGGGVASKGGGKKGSGGTGASAAKAQNIARFQELLDGLRIYFDKSLPLILLYPQERNQYEKITLKYPGKEPSELYGAEHFLRLFVKLPTLLAQTTFTPQEATQVESKVGEFLAFLQQKHSEYFVQHEAEESSAEDG